MMEVFNITHGFVCAFKIFLIMLNFIYSLMKHVKQVISTI